ncbi:DgyrCDS4416 [Dimorphilus gyrociliatus]|uniref:DgyrCDS4416 n=1 Tax=Dimorphilus gyrociliatus TaxID=2664684 RepID=A0A7I8VIE0_9ANNE|nr:DgyrCDS4416 [Dimorphilus gyrociliatus]
MRYTSTKARKLNVTVPNKESPEKFEPSTAAELFISNERERILNETAVDFNRLEKLFEQFDIIDETKKIEESNTTKPKNLPSQPSKIIEAIENIEFDSENFAESITLASTRDVQGILNEKKKPLLRGSPDPTTPISKTPCGGCGAFLHCQNPGIPGYMPSEQFKIIPSYELRSHICQRCFMMKELNVVTDLALPPEEYENVIKEIENKNHLSIIVVDLLDMPNSLYAGFKQLINKKQPVYVLGNKVDLIPKDAPGYLKRINNTLRHYCQKLNIAPQNKIHYLGLISAKTGYGIEDLVTKLLKDWKRKGDIYIYGCTNSGKSTLFNILLKSDYCDNWSKNFVLPASTSNWPGTTLNLLKFPIMEPADWKIAKREKRLKRLYNEEREEKRIENKRQKDLRTSPLYGEIESTLLPHQLLIENENDMSFLISDSTYEYNSESNSVQAKIDDPNSFKAAKYDDDKFKKQKFWCYDTPGLVNPDQIINNLTQEELAAIMPVKLIKPRTFLIKPKQVLFASGLGRVDVVEANTSIYLTLFAQNNLPVFIKKYGREADDFYEEHIGSETLTAPLGDSDRLNTLSSLIGKEFVITGIGWTESVVDITLSSLGWFSITAGTGMTVKLRVYTPGGVGIHQRESPILPFAINNKGKRLKQSQEYSQLSQQL